MIQVFVKEFNSFLNSLIAYIVIGAFLTGIGLLMWVFPETSVLDYGFADLDTLFSMAPYVFIFLIPAITMKSFAEEKKMGTLELLLTKPLSDWNVVLGKFLATCALVLSWLGTSGNDILRCWTFSILAHIESNCFIYTRCLFMFYHLHRLRVNFFFWRQCRFVN
jgi:ABC-type transport system involved in multi-copper enzyme maturation permease subunit